MRKEFSKKHNLIALAILTLAIAVLPQTMQAQQDAEPSVDHGTQLPVLSHAPSRVVEHVDDAKLIKLPGNTHPMARKEFDQGVAEPGKLLERMVLVLQRSPEQEAALAAFNERQYDPKSPDFHHWLEPEEFGELYGPSDSDMMQIKSWLQNHGFTIDVESKGRVTIQFTGTVDQVQSAFHVEMHNYMVAGKMHLSNDRDPSIPAALAPVMAGVASLNDFRPKHQSHFGNYVSRDMKTGKFTELHANRPVGGPAKGGVHASTEGQLKPRPEFGYIDANWNTVREMLTPYDVATIYNILPLWNEGINGKGINVAILGESDVEPSDFNTFRSSFGLPAETLKTIHAGTDPGFTSDGQGENTEDVEMAGATAPGAQIVIVNAADTSTTTGILVSAIYVAENPSVASILSGSYGACELDLGAANNKVLNANWQQVSTEGVSFFESAGDQGSAGCDNQNTDPSFDSIGLQVNGYASSPYITAVGGTDLQWPFQEPGVPFTAYWGPNNATTGASALGYMPEMAWNSTCSNPLLLPYFANGGNDFPNTETLCNVSASQLPEIAHISAGSGGVSNCTAPTGTTTATCAGGYAKPSWQKGVTGIPTDNLRHIPDVSMFASYGFGQGDNVNIPGTSLLICQASNDSEYGCDYKDPSQIIYQENGGTSAAAPMTAGIMALVLQKQGGARQGLANPVFYKLAAGENYANCNSSTIAAKAVAPTNSCIFYDTTAGTNGQICKTGDPNCVTSTSGDAYGILSGYAAGVGYDMATGLGSMNVTNLVNAWGGALTPQELTVSPTSLVFTSTAVGTASATQTVTIKNTGAGANAVHITNIAASATSFIPTATTCPAATTTLAAGASCTVSVEFKPTATGTQTATLMIDSDATGSPQSIGMSGSIAAASTHTLSLSPTSLAFGTETVGSTTAAQVITVKNTGTGALTLTSETVSAPFLKSATTCTTALAVGASCTVSVTYKPTSAVASTGTLVVASNGTSTPASVALTGTGKATTTLTLSLSPTSLAFGTETVGTTTAAQVVTVKNTSSGPVTLTSETVLAPFVKSASNCGSSLNSGAYCTVSIEYKPTAAGASSGTLVVASNGTSTPASVALTGTGTSNAALTLSPTSLAFGSVKVGTESATQVVTIKNNTSAAVPLSSITIPTPFVKTASNCGATVPNGGACTVTIAYKPTAAGASSGSLVVTSTAAGSPFSVTLTGTGTSGAALTLSPASLAFGSVKVGTTTAAQVVTVKNTSSGPVTLTSETVSAPFVKSASNCGSSLNSGAYCTVSIEYKPTAAGASNGTLVVASGAAGSPFSIALTGTGTSSAALTLSPTSLAFGSVKVGTESATQVVTIKNNTSAAVPLSSITIPTPFVKTASNCGATVPNGGACTVTIAYKPTAAGASSGSLVVTSTAAGSPFSVTLTGTGD